MFSIGSFLISCKPVKGLLAGVPSGSPITRIPLARWVMRRWETLGRGHGMTIRIRPSLGATLITKVPLARWVMRRWETLGRGHGMTIRIRPSLGATLITKMPLARWVMRRWETLGRGHGLVIHIRRNHGATLRMQNNYISVIWYRLLVSLDRRM